MGEDDQEMMECLEDPFADNCMVLDMAQLGPRALALYQEGYEHSVANARAADVAGCAGAP